MRTNKKELLEIVLIFVLGGFSLLLIAFNVDQYNNKFSNTQNQIDFFSNDL